MRVADLSPSGARELSLVAAAVVEMRNETAARSPGDEHTKALLADADAWIANATRLLGGSL